MNPRKKRPCGRRRVRLRMDATRECGDCEACCWAMAIDEREAPMFSKCRDQRSQVDGERPGCSAYEDRPIQCQRYRCEWLVGMTYHGIPAASLRPDKAGIMLNWWDHPYLGKLLVATEVCAGGLDKPIAGYILDSIQHMLLVLVVGQRGLRLLGPPDRLEWARRMAHRAAGHSGDASARLEGPGGGKMEAQSP